MQEIFADLELFYDTPYHQAHSLIPDEFLMKISNLHTHPVQQLPNLIEKVLSDREPTDIQLQQLSDIDLAILNKVKDKTKAKIKRPDELQKMFFKRAVKYAQTKFFKKKKNKRVNMFYKHYFEEAAERIGCSILNFYHPNKQLKSGNKTGQKSFNATYIKLILSSPSFRKICEEFMAEFVKDSYKERKTKIIKLIETCKRMSHKETQKQVVKIDQQIFLKDEDYQKKLSEKFENKILNIEKRVSQGQTPQIQRLQSYFSSGKCKIPWCDKDIQLAFKCAQETLHDNFDDGS